MPAKKKKGRGGARMGAGRKHKPPRETQRNAVSVTFTDAEQVQLKRAAGHESLAGFIRRLVLGHLARRK